MKCIDSQVRFQDAYFQLHRVVDRPKSTNNKQHFVKCDSVLFINLIPGLSISMFEDVT